MQLASVRRQLHFARAFQSRAFALLWTGQAVSSLGDGVFTTALAWEVLIKTGSASAMSAVVVARYIPMVLFFLIGGVSADRLPRRLLLLYSDSGRAVIVLLIALLDIAHILQIWHLVVLSIFFGIVNSFFSPAYYSIVPELVSEGDLRSANSLNSLSRQVNGLLGPLLGAAIVAMAGAAVGFAFDGVTFLVSALCLCAMRVSHPTRLSSGIDKPSQPRAFKQKSLQVFHDVLEGFRYVAGTGWLWVSIVIAAIANIGFMGTLMIALPKLVHDFYGAGVWLLGALLMTFSAGSIVAALFVGQLEHLRRRGIVGYLALLMAGVALAFYGMPVAPVVREVIPLVASFVVGFGIGAFEVIWDVLLQEFVPSAKLGRVNSIDLLGSYSLMPLGYAIIGILTDHMGPGVVFLAGGILNIVLASIALCIPGVRHLD